MARAGRPCGVSTFLGFPVTVCLHMCLSILALHSILSEFSGHLGLRTLVPVNDSEAEDVAASLLPLLKSVDLSVYFEDELPQYQVLHRYLRPFDEPPAPKAYSAWEVAGESLQSMAWRALDDSYSKTTLSIMLNMVFAVVTYSERKLRVEQRSVVKLSAEGHPQVEDGVARLITFNINRRLI